jgi:PHD/YefM family antitoxin component YafN of YafNO toxin-antitoxin module
MKEHTIPFSEIQQEIPHLPDRFTEPLEAAIITRDKRKVMAILPYPTYKALLGYIESLEETLEIMGDPEMMAAIRQAEEDIKNGKIISLDDCLKELGWE